MDAAEEVPRVTPKGRKKKSVEEPGSATNACMQALIATAVAAVETGEAILQDVVDATPKPARKKKAAEDTPGEISIYVELQFTP